MSMLIFYINRAGKNLDASQRQVLDAFQGRSPRAPPLIAQT